jgi:hypothetical protein
MKCMAVALITGVTLMWCASPVRADEASKSAKAEELLQLTQTDQMMKMLEPMKDMLTTMMNKTDMPAEERAKAGEMQEKVMALVFDRLNKAKPALVKIYTDTYTEEEIDGILAFHKSPAGRAMLQKMPQVMQRSMPVIMQLMGDLQPEIRRMTEEMKQKSN